MALFQKTVELKYLKQFDAGLIQTKFQEFKNYFGNAAIQENIRNSKEEQYQEGFLRELFVHILGYKLNPTPDFNLTTEYKNIKDGKKADGAILLNKGDHSVVTAVIELKGTDTTDLNKIEAQAFGYKNNQPECVYVVTSNFEKLRFYIGNAIEYVEFNLFTLSKSDFGVLWLCLAFESIEKGIPHKVKEESISQEDVITKKLYQDYSLFKRELHQNLVTLNPEFDSLTLFKKSQKLIDRFLFLFFAEDRHLLPPNSVRLILNDWRDLQERDVEIPLFNRFRKYFGYLNTGYKGKRYDVFAYNGGLFKPDEVLDTIRIDDELLFRHTWKLSEYDFVSEIDVNILGHIFENSLNELDELEKSALSRRKRDGVFYTPKYITRYMVENTVGKLCTEKKSELQLIEEEYTTDKRRPLKTNQALFEKLKAYQNWLLQLTICDPACGSGAFLNQALDFLINEHRYIDELQAKLLGVPLIFSDIDKSILENNLYGVDLNEESVEIAKLSLWLRTAQPNRKLSDLNNNLRCGNSLIDDPAMAGEKAFNWQEAFPQVFEKGGFDVVIGNPPYVQLQSMGEMSELLSKCGYLTYNKSADLYCLFYERGCQILKPKGILSYITSNKWLRVNYGESLRKFLTEKVNPKILIDFPGIPVFADAVVDPHILIFTKEPYQGKTEACAVKTNTTDLKTVFEADKSIREFSSQSWIIVPPNEARKLEQMNLNSTELKDLPISINYGIKTGFNDAFYIDDDTRQKLIAADARSAELIKPMARGRDITPYSISGFEYLIGTFPALNLDIENYPAIKAHLLSFGFDRLKQTGDSGARKKTSGKWFETQDSINYHGEFAKPKIIYPNMTSVFPFMYDERGFFSNDKSFILTANNNSVSLLFFTALFNSSLAKLWIWWNCPELGDNRREIRKVYFERFPVPPANKEQTATLAQYAATRTQLTADLQTLCSKFTRNIQREHHLDKLSTRLENWHQLSFSEFLKELEKSRVKLSLSQKAEWEDYFLQESEKAKDIKHRMDIIDKEIDQMVYTLYGLTEEKT